MRVAYLITAYRDLEHLERLCAVLEREDPSALITVQFDVGSSLAPRAMTLERTIRLTQSPIRWGDGSYVRAILDSLRALMKDDWEWIVLLSGQDYPLRPLHELYQELKRGEHRAYSTTTARLPGAAPSSELVQRYTYRYWWTRGSWPRWLRALARRGDRILGALSRDRVRIQLRPRGLGPGIGLRRRSTIFGEDRPCYMGSDYVAMQRQACDEVLRLLDREPEILDYFAQSFVPSEGLFASVLRWNDPATVANRSFHFMRFSGRANPRRLTPEDLPELWELGAVFGRKFEDEDDWVETMLPMRRQPI